VDDVDVLLLLAEVVPLGLGIDIVLQNNPLELLAADFLAHLAQAPLVVELVLLGL
jgi:hypothetical protein